MLLFSYMVDKLVDCQLNIENKNNDSSSSGMNNHQVKSAIIKTFSNTRVMKLLYLICLESYKISKEKGNDKYNLFNLFNDFYAPDSKIECCDLSLHGLQEFIHPQGFFTQLKHLEHPIFIAKGNHWTLQLFNHVSFSVIDDDLLNIINCQNKAALDNITHQLKKTKEYDHFDRSRSI